MSKKEYAFKTVKLGDAKVCIGVPGANWAGDFGMSLISLVAHCYGTPFRNRETVEIGLQNSKGSILPQLRQKLVDGAKAQEATHLLFLDSDMVFPPHLLHQLIEHDMDIVACNCPVKTLPSNPTARFAPTLNHPTGEPVYQENYVDREDPLVKVWRVGTGVMLVKMEVFNNIPYPNFPIRYDADLDVFVGEDWGFCELAEAAGHDIYVDVHASFSIGHVGDLRYTHDMALSEEVVERSPRIVIPD